jgi:hypothetical protein
MDPEKQNNVTSRQLPAAISHGIMIDARGVLANRWMIKTITIPKADPIIANNTVWCRIYL